MRIPFVDLGRQFLAHEKDFTEIFVNVGRSGGYVLGAALEHFERAVADYCGVKHALGVGSGSDAAVLIMRGFGIGPGDEVITAPNSFIATAWTIAAVGAKPRFADIGRDLNLDPVAVENAITAKTKAIVPVHLTGRPAAMDEINLIAERHGLKVIEDAAQAFGARYKNLKAGALGDAAAFSLHPLKNLNVMGDGGLITTDDDDLAEACGRLRNHGLINRDVCTEWGINSRLDCLQAELARYKLGHIDAWNARFREIAARYTSGLADCVETPVDNAHEHAVYHNYVIYAKDRDGLMAHLSTHGVESKIHYPVLLHLQPAAVDLGYKPGDFPVAEELVDKMVSLPIYPELQDEEIDHVIASIRSFYGR